jgi:NAD(P)-dependent dehydrogenase (short-subunit alcohol dehydrogenase family)
MDFKGKVVIVTGSSSGIGEGCARKLLDLGARVAGFDVNPARISHPVFKSYAVDVADDPAVRAAVDEVERAFGPVDGLVTCAGITAIGKPFYELSVQEWGKVIATNLTGTFLCAKYVAKAMVTRKSGAIVTISCVRSRTFGPNMADYSASKGGVVALTSAMAVELAPFGIRVNSVAPGVTETRITEKALKDPEMRRNYEKGIPLGRVAQPGDIADAAAFLLSDEARYVTGQTLFVDGGYSLAK